jgi:hypothetical protein
MEAVMKKQELERRIRAHGFSIRYVEYCEDGDTPGGLGSIRGVTNWSKREIKIGLKANRTKAELVDCLAHELRHIEQPDWDCGNRDVFGRGSPRRNAA